MKKNTTPKEFVDYGIGCFGFFPKREVPFKLSEKDFCADIRNYLDSIPAISNIEISCSNPDNQITIKRPRRGFSEDLTFPPFSHSIKISFRLYIPARVQEELFPSHRALKVSSENFLIHIQPEFYSSVTFIEPIASKGSSRPSDSIVIVREYLRKHAPKDNILVQFDCLGPSPLHAKFHLIPKKKKSKVEDNVLSVKRFEIKGYDKIFILYTPEYFQNIEQVKMKFISCAADELSVFYAIKMKSLKSIQLWSEIQKSSNMFLKIKILHSIEK